jgi:hypothetical protein
MHSLHGLLVGGLQWLVNTFWCMPLIGAMHSSTAQFSWQHCSVATDAVLYAVTALI